MNEEMNVTPAQQDGAMPAPADQATPETNEEEVSGADATEEAADAEKKEGDEIEASEEESQDSN